MREMGYDQYPLFRSSLVAFLCISSGHSQFLPFEEPPGLIAIQQKIVWSGMPFQVRKFERNGIRSRSLVSKFARCVSLHPKRSFTISSVRRAARRSHLLFLCHDRFIKTTLQTLETYLCPLEISCLEKLLDGHEFGDKCFGNSCTSKAYGRTKTVKFPKENTGTLHNDNNVLEICLDM